MDYIDITTLQNFFNTGGYVLDFSTDSFDTFCQKSVGIAPCCKFGLSKGKSLIEFTNECSESESIKLFSDLLKYYEYNYANKSFESEERHEQFLLCKKIIEKYSNITEISTPAINKVNREYLESISKRALEDIKQGNFDSALTKSRTMLEETFCYVLELKNITPITDGNIKNLFHKVQENYNMHQDKQTDKRVNNLLSGINKIVDSISEMRNKNSDAHGVGANRINIKDYHARLFVNSAMTISEFILSVAENAQK